LHYRWVANRRTLALRRFALSIAIQSCVRSDETCLRSKLHHMATTPRTCLPTPGDLWTGKGILNPRRHTCTPFSHAPGSPLFETRTMTGLLLLATPCVQPTAFEAYLCRGLLWIRHFPGHRSDLHLWFGGIFCSKQRIWRIPM